MPVTFGGAGSQIKAIGILFPTMGCQTTLNLIVVFSERRIVEIRHGTH